MWEYVTLQRMKRCAGGKGSRKVNSTLSPPPCSLCRSRIFFLLLAGMLLLSLLYVGDRQQQKKEEKSEHRRWDKVEWLMRCDDFVEVFFFWKDEKISIHSRMQWIYLVLLCAPTHNPLKHSECVESRSSDDDDDDDDERAAEKNDIEIYGSSSAIPRNNTFPRHYPFSVA